MSSDRITDLELQVLLLHGAIERATEQLDRMGAALDAEEER